MLSFKYRPCIKWALSVLFIVLLVQTGYTRVGGAGGSSGGSSGSSSSGSSSGGWHSSSYSSDGNESSGGGGSIDLSGWVIVFIVVGVIIVYNVVSRQPFADDDSSSDDIELPREKPQGMIFPEGLTRSKLEHAFFAIQEAWSKKDLTKVRRWLSDGMYRRLTTQIEMMNRLGQENKTWNITVDNIIIANRRTDNNYETAEVAVSFTMSDSFTSSKYPQLNENYENEAAKEYWTFIRRKNGNHANLYVSNTCPNCGSTLPEDLGEISRCIHCKSLTNSATYDWVLSEITQERAYSGGAGLANNYDLKTLMANDKWFSAQRAEDIASNVFMQLMSACTGKHSERLRYFANQATIDSLTSQLARIRPFVFDRLFIESCRLTEFEQNNGLVVLTFSVRATYRKAYAGNTLTVEGDFVTREFELQLSRSAKYKANNETVYSHECSSCGAPFDDTTNHKCNYCDAPVVDVEHNWVLSYVSPLPFA